MTHRCCSKLLIGVAASSLVLLLQGCGQDGGGGTTITTTVAPVQCTIEAPIGGCNLISAMEGHCCEPLNMSNDVIVNGPEYPMDPRLVPKGLPLGKNFTFGLPWAQSIFARTYNESFSNPGYLSGQAEKKGLANTAAYYNAAMNWTRPIVVYIPAGFQVSAQGAKVQFIMDGEQFCSPSFLLGLATGIANSIKANELPLFVVVCVASGLGAGEGGDRLRDFEYETMSDRNAKFFVEDVLPAVEQNPDIQLAYPGFKFSVDRKDRATMGCSSSGAASVIASWFAPQHFYRAVGFSATLVQILSTPCPQGSTASQCESATNETLKVGFPRGAWDIHSNQDLIISNAKKDIRIYHQAGQFDILGCSYYKAKGAITDCAKDFTQSGNEGYFNIRLANNRTAARLMEKNYATRFVYSLNQSHCTAVLNPQGGGSTIFDGLVWSWQDDEVAENIIA